ncbi:MAG: copper resistance protein NlpE [Bacteroidetes bacterium]|jgi:uncharacterized lipoprotein NlpE involved in copper resistance|nr:copper resistance protein NlpE [Bacteroidota bacterium]
MRAAIILAILSLTFFASCRSGEGSDISEEAPIVRDARTVNSMDNSRTSLDWAGIYEGVAYCDTCEDMKTILRLSKDNTFELKQTANVNGNEEIRYQNEGKFTWEDNGSEIIVESGEIVIRFQVRENEVRMLDMKGNVIDAQLANFYSLTKQ